MSSLQDRSVRFALSDQVTLQVYVSAGPMALKFYANLGVDVSLPTILICPFHLPERISLVSVVLSDRLDLSNSL